MKKVHVKLNKVLAVVLAALMVCLSLPMDRVLADTVSPGDSAEETLSDGAAGAAPADGAAENTPADGTGENAPAGPLAAAAARDTSPYIFSYDGETYEGDGTDLLFPLSTGDHKDKFGKKNSLTFTTDTDVTIPFTEAITSGTAVFEVELCPASKCKQSIIFKNSAADSGDILFVLVADAANNQYYLSDTAAGSIKVDLGVYSANAWCRLRTELYLDESDGGLKFRVSVMQQKYPDSPPADKYNAEETVWKVVKTITQDDLKTANGTVTADIDGSAAHPIDLGSITLRAATNPRWIGDMFLYDITGVTLEEQPGEQTQGADFAPGEAAVKVTYSTGEQTIRLADLVYDGDYTTEKSEAGKYVVCYGGKKLETTADVPAPLVTGIQVKTAPTKTTYAIGESLDTAGLVVEALLSDKTTAPLTVGDDYTVSTPDTSTAGVKTVTVTYKSNEEFTDEFKIRVEDGSDKKPAIFDYTGDAVSLDELGLAEASNVELSDTAVAGSSGQHLAFTGAGTVAKSWDPLNTGIVKINVEFNQANDKNIAQFHIYDGDGKLLLNFYQQKSGNVNLYKNELTSGDNAGWKTLIASSSKDKVGVWVRLETEIDLDASNAAEQLIFTTKSYYKANYADEWTPGEEVTNETFEEWEVSCATPDLVKFSVGSLKISQTAGSGGVVCDNIEVLATAPAESQSFVYIDAEDITDLEFDAPVGFLSVVNTAVGSNETNKLLIKGESATKTLNKPISTGKVTLETVSNHNGKILGIKILNSEGHSLVNYSQQSSGNLNMYKGDAITGSKNTVNLASGDNVKSKWIKVVTTIDLDKSNELGVLQFEMSVSYKGKYTDEEWIPVKTYTQQETYVEVTSNASANGCATEGITSFDIGGIQFGSQQGETYVDDIIFNDGNGVSGVVTITEKVLKSIEITTPAATTEFVQDSKIISTEGMVLTGTYDVTYSDGHVETDKTFKITKYDVECDTSQVADAVPVTIKVTDGDNVFTKTYNVKITPKPDGSYVTFSYTDEGSVAQTGFDGSKISVASGDVSGNGSKKIKLDKGTSVTTLATPCTTGSVHFETEFLTTATSKASLFLRILNSEGKPMVDLAQYGSGNLNLYIDKQTSGTDGAMAHTFQGLPVNQWAKTAIDIDLEQTREQGHLVFDAVVWTKADYAGEWTVHAEFDQDLYLNSITAPTTTGSASTDATVLDVASIELYNAGGTNYYDNMFFEAIRGDVKKEVTSMTIASPAIKTDYTVGDGLNRTGLVLWGTYTYTFPNGDVKTREAEVTQYTVSFDNSQPGDEVPVYLTAGSVTVSYNVTVRPNTALDDIEAYLVKFINNKLVNLDAANIIHVNKRQVRFPVETANGEALSWEVASGDASVAENVLTVVPSAVKDTEVVLKVTLSTKNNDGDPVSFSKTLNLSVPKESGRMVDDSLTTEASLRNAIAAMYARGMFEGQEYLTGVDAVMANLDRNITVEEVAVILVNMFNIDTTYTDTKISRKDVAEDAWYTKYVKAAFQLSVETRDSREGKEEYGIGKGISRDNLLYMIDRIVHIDQTTMPSDYADRMFE